jgi:Mrp family chromosome partitioning ATPase
VAFVAASSGHGKTVTVANTAIAAAAEGHKVLAIDADFGEQGLARLLGERVVAETTLDSVTSRVSLHQIDVVAANGGALHLLARGGLPGRSASFFSSDEARTVLRAAEIEYDLVLLDVPPLLQVAYTSTLVSYLGGALVVVPHGSRVTAIEEVKDRVELTGTPIIGYVFTLAPLRRDLKGSGASVLRARMPAEARPEDTGPPERPQ